MIIVPRHSHIWRPSELHRGTLAIQDNNLLLLDSIFKKLILGSLDQIMSKDVKLTLYSKKYGKLILNSYSCNK